MMGLRLKNSEAVLTLLDQFARRWWQRIFEVVLKVVGTPSIKSNKTYLGRFSSCSHESQHAQASWDEVSCEW